MKDTLEVCGAVCIHVKDKDSNLIETIEFQNLVVNLGRAAIASMLGSGNEDKRLTHICFGDNGVPASLTDTTITNEFSKPFDSFDYVGTSVVFSWNLALSECNGMMLQEFGIRCFDGDLFARTTRAIIEKTPDIQLSGTWTITI